MGQICQRDETIVNWFSLHFHQRCDHMKHVSSGEAYTYEYMDFAANMFFVCSRLSNAAVRSDTPRMCSQSKVIKRFWLLHRKSHMQPFVKKNENNYMN